MVSSEERHQLVWNEFLSLKRTLPTEKRDHKGWRRGRTKYAVWTIGIQSESVWSRFDAARVHLAEFLLEPYRRQPHVTLFVCGFLAEVEQLDDDYSVERLARHLRELIGTKISPFEIEIKGVNSFAAAPFLEVSDVTGGMQQIRDVLSSTHAEVRSGEYVPHLTLGLYSDHFETAIVAERISSFGAVAPVTHVVDEISLITYSASEIAGPLEAKYAVALSAR